MKTARWQSGYAADCKSVYVGSIPTRASIFFNGYDKKLIHKRGWIARKTDELNLKKIEEINLSQVYGCSGSRIIR